MHRRVVSVIYENRSALLQENAAETIDRSLFKRIELWIVFYIIYILCCGAGVTGSRTGEGPHLKILPAGVQEIRQESGSHCGESFRGESFRGESFHAGSFSTRSLTNVQQERTVANAFPKVKSSNNFERYIQVYLGHHFLKSFLCENYKTSFFVFKYVIILDLMLT
jgi:hypothetical protein